MHDSSGFPGGAPSFTRAASQQPERQPPRRWWARCAGATPSNWMTTATSRWLCPRRRCAIAILPACAPAPPPSPRKRFGRSRHRRDRRRLTLSPSETRARAADHRTRRERRQDGRRIPPEGRREQGACPPRASSLPTLNEIAPPQDRDRTRAQSPFSVNACHHISPFASDSVSARRRLTVVAFAP